MARDAQIQLLCPDCATGLEIFPVFHHMICAYIGPRYDFPETETGYRCPKCGHGIQANDPACEIIGTSSRCPHCGRETVMPPAATTEDVIQAGG